MRLTTTTLLACVAASTLATSALAQSDGKPTPAAPIKAVQVKDGAKAPAEDIKPLTVGDAAPAFEISDWLRGDKVEKFDAGKVTVMEFWATWCGPCRMSIPHLSELQERYKDYGVRFIGLSDEKLDTVKPFIEKDEWVQKMRYTVATDPDRSVFKSYMQAAGQNGIPTAFIVGKTGKVEWIGHPMNMEEPLDQIVHDKWDVGTFKTKFDAETAASRERMKQMRSMQEASQKGDWDGLVKIYDEILAKNPDDANTAIQKMTLLLTKAKKTNDGYALAREIAAKNGKNAMIINSVAWTIVDTDGIEPRDVDLALDIAKKAVAASNEKDGTIIDTLARCHWEKGDKAKAIELQKKACDLTKDGPMAEQLKKTLQEYEKGEAK